MTADAADPDLVRAAVVWRHDPGALAAYPRLGFVQALGHGVDAVLDDPHLPDVPVARLVDPALAGAIGRWVLRVVLHHTQDIDAYADQQRRHVWRPLAYRRPADVTVGVLGLGEIGRAVAAAVEPMGHPVVGWRRSDGTVDGVEVLGELEAVVACSDVLVAALPSTPSTRGLLTAADLAGLPDGAAFVNVGRGDLIATEQLLAALDAGRPAVAHLDVTDPEPPPGDSPLWAHPHVHLTPHVSGPTDPVTAAPIVVANVVRFLHGDRPRWVVDRSAGY